MTYLQEMAKHEAWMKQAQRNRLEFQAEMAAIEAETARVEALLDEDEPEEPIDRGCRYCGQDFCICESRYGVVQGIVSRREAGRKA